LPLEDLPERMQQEKERSQKHLIFLDSHITAAGQEMVKGSG